ncbi:hypothetical protein J4457_00225 [Candidatus Woesearchaeota archaeon]|nr:hypothetical protein [Candidatus Woesearchaeota archaeon]
MYYAPLHTSFMITAMLGLIISLSYVWDYSETWAVAFATVFFCMFVASMIAMRHANPDQELAPR